MNAAIEGGTVARPKARHGGPRPGAGRPKASDRDDVTVRLDRQVAAQARYVAESRGITLAEYLSETLRPVAAKDFARAGKGILGGE